MPNGWPASPAKPVARLAESPNIAAIYGLEEAAAPRLVMELVEGDDRAQRIARGPIPLDEALPIARQIAGRSKPRTNRASSTRPEAREHKVRSDGTVKVLDFGLAKAMERAAGDVGNRAAGRRRSPHRP